MATINRVVLVGNLTRDPELRATAAGTSVCRMRIACNTTWRNRETGEIDERPNYFDVTTFGASGEACARFLAKGRPVAVDGRLEWHEWQNADGETQAGRRRRRRQRPVPRVAPGRRRARRGGRGRGGRRRRGGGVLMGARERDRAGAPGGRAGNRRHAAPERSVCSPYQRVRCDCRREARPRERAGHRPVRRGFRRRHAARRGPFHRRDRGARQRPRDAAELPGRDPRPGGHARRGVELPDPLRRARHPHARRHAERADRDEPGGAEARTSPISSAARRSSSTRTRSPSATCRRPATRRTRSRTARSRAYVVQRVPMNTLCQRAMEGMPTTVSPRRAAREEPLRAGPRSPGSTTARPP